MPVQKSSQKSSRKSKTTPKGKRILITGGLGLIGHNVVVQLQKKKHHVEIVDVLTTYGSTNRDELEYLYNERIAKLHPDSILHQVDINNLAFDDVFANFKPEIVIHLASFPREKAVKANPIEAAYTMCQGLTRVLENCKTYGVQKILYASSSMVYGNFEDDVAEDAVLNPQGAYAVWKAAGENLVKEYHRAHGLDYVIIRPSAVYGPLDIGDRVIAKFLLTAMKDGTLNVNGANEKLDFTYVEDCAAGMVAAVLSKHTGTYNITKSHSCTLKEAAELAVKLAGKGKINVRDKDADFPSRGALDISRAKKDFGYAPKVDIAEGFEIYYKWLSTSEYWNPKPVEPKPKRVITRKYKPKK